MVHFLATNPAAWHELHREVTATVGDDPLDAAVMREMPWLNGVVSKTPRLGSPGYIAGRRIDAAFDVCGFTLPPGAFVFYVPYVTHRLSRCRRPDSAVDHP